MALLSRREGDLPKRSLWQKIKEVALTDVGVLARGGISPGSLEQVEEVLLAADLIVSLIVNVASRRA